MGKRKTNGHLAHGVVERRDEIGMLRLTRNREADRQAVKLSQQLGVPFVTVFVGSLSAPELLVGPEKASGVAAIQALVERFRTSR